MFIKKRTFHLKYSNVYLKNQQYKFSNLPVNVNIAVRKSSIVVVAVFYGTKLKDALCVYAATNMV